MGIIPNEYDKGMNAGIDLATPKWKPIETIPYDTMVLLYGPYGIWEGFIYDAANAEEMWGKANTPTHWMPLPEPPKGESDD